MLNTDRTAANLAIVQNCYALFGQGDVAGMLRNFMPDATFELVGDASLFPLFGSYKGPDKIAGFFGKVAEAMEFSAFVPVSMHAVADRVYIEGHYDFTLRATGAAVSADWLSVFVLKDGIVTSVREHSDTARFVAAARAAEAANLALVRQTYADFGSGDVEAILSRCDPAIEWISGGSRDDFPTLGRRKGIDGAASFFADVAAHDEFSSFEPREMIAIGDTVVALGHYGITAKSTGRHFESDWAHVFTIAGGKATRFQEYTDTAAFLKAK